MKTAQVTKDVQRQEANQGKENGLTDFFAQRDSSVTDIEQVLENESIEKDRLYKESLKELPLKESVQPMFNSLFLTARRNKIKTDGGLFLPTASFSGEGATDLELDFADIQKVLATGPQVAQAIVGMEVKLNMESFKRKLDSNLAQKINKEYAYVMPLEVIDGIEYIMISERDISYISNSMGLVKEEKE
jgi:hypothetical protein